MWLLVILLFLAVAITSYLLGNAIGALMLIESAEQTNDIPGFLFQYKDRFHAAAVRWLIITVLVLAVAVGTAIGLYF